MDINSIEAGSRLLASTLHEIRTPIQTIISSAELLEATSLNTEQTEYTRQIEFSANALLQLANDVLDFTKMQTSSFKLECIPYDAATLTERVVDTICMEAFKKGLEVITDIDPTLPSSIMGDPVRIQQVILNLVKNAVKFTEKGFILVRVSVNKAKALFEIIDSGIGIPKEKQNLVFNEFYQIDSSTARRSYGTGLGLAICHNLVKMMGGTIGVLQNPSGGSNFWFSVPFESAEITQTDEQKTPSLKDNIFVIEPSALARKALARKLSVLTQGMVVCAKNCSEAEHILSEAKYNDVKFSTALSVLPESDEESALLANNLSCSPHLRNAEFLLMVPEGTNETRSIPGIRGFFSGVIRKPIKREQLKNILSHENSMQIHTAQEQFGSQPFPKIAKGLVILIAEDHPVNRKLLQTFVERFGAEIFLAEDGIEAVEQTERHPEIDMIFMDILMPRKNGLDATVEIRKKGYRGIIVACTANNDPSIFDSYKEIGINDILIKPFKKDQIQQTIEKWNSLLTFQDKNDILSLVSVYNMASKLWDVVDFMDTTGNDPELSVSVMDEYMDQTRSILVKLKEEVAKQYPDFQTIELYLHTLKGSSMSVSANKFSSYAQKMQKSISEKNMVEFEATRTEFALDFLRLTDIVEKWKSSL